jgi:hypothetical protein
LYYASNNYNDSTAPPEVLMILTSEKALHPATKWMWHKAQTSDKDQRSTEKQFSTNERQRSTINREAIFHVN